MKPGSEGDEREWDEDLGKGLDAEETMLLRFKEKIAMNANLPVFVNNYNGVCHLSVCLNVFGGDADGFPLLFVSQGHDFQECP